MIGYDESVRTKNIVCIFAHKSDLLYDVNETELAPCLSAIDFRTLFPSLDIYECYNGNYCKRRQD
jgi:hypothetical protein